MSDNCYGGNLFSEYGVGIGVVQCSASYAIIIQSSLIFAVRIRIRLCTRSIPRLRHAKSTAPLSHG